MHPDPDPIAPVPTSSGRARPNLGWLLGGRLVHVVVAFLVGLLVVRYLGPDELGVLAVATAFAGLFVPVSSIGSQIVVRQLAVAPGERRAILGSAAALAALAGVAGYVTALGTAFLFVAPSRVTALIAISSLPLLLAPLKVLDHWFEATLGAKHATTARTVALVTASTARVGVVVAGGDVFAFAWVLVAEQVAVFALLATFYRRHGGRVRAWVAEPARVRALASQSFPLLVATLAGAVYMRLDQVMLGALSTEREAGLYAAVVRLTEASYFLPVAISASFAPGIARLRTTDRLRYEAQVSRMLTALAGLALLIAVPAALLADPLISVLLGDAYDGAGPVLSIYVVSSIFVFLGVGQTTWMVNESLQRLAMWRALGGAAMNLALNLVLIPRLAATGAAIATLITYAFAGWLANIVHPATRPMFWMQLRALDPRRQYRLGVAELRLSRSHMRSRRS